MALAAGSLAVGPASYTWKPVSISFVPGLSTNGTESRYISSALSLNIVGGSIGRVRGVELGSVFNLDDDHVLGYQAAGVVNITGGGFGGVQQAGVVNIVAGRFAGAQTAGVVNVTGAAFVGAQLAGVVNVAGEGLRGAQLAGVANIASGRMAGLQMSGVVNVADEFSGAQIGLVNVTGKGSGLQLGLVNVADEMDVPIGLVSIVENGMFHANVWATEFAPLNMGVKTGSNIIYNVFMFGWRPDGDSTRLFAGIGLGGHVPLGRFFTDIDLLSHGAWRGPDWNPRGGSDLLSSLRLTAGWQVTDWLAVTAGPTLSVWVSDREDGSAVPFYDAPLFQWHGQENVRIWPGFTVGLQGL
jgi:hypothetical protein